MLFIDLDETLIKSIPNRVVKNADYVFKFNGITYSMFLRPDYMQLKNHPFVIFTASLCGYANIVYKFLKAKGLNVQGFMCRDHMKAGANVYPNVKGLLFDNNKNIAAAKLRKMPKVRWVPINPFDVKKGELQIIDNKMYSMKQAVALAEAENVFADTNNKG